VNQTEIMEPSNKVQKRNQQSYITVHQN